MLESLEHHELLVFWAQLLIIYLAARSLGRLARKVGLPSVVGELFAGLMLGPSIFGVVWPDAFHWFLPESEVQSSLLLAVSWLSAAFLLVVAGFETDLKMMARLGGAAAIVTIGSMVVPLAGGLAVASQMPEAFYGERATSGIFMLFIATSISVSALAVVAKILGDLGLMRRDVGQLTVAVGMANDLIGWVLLGVLAGLAVSGQVSLLDITTSVGGLALFMVFALTIGQRLVDTGLRAARRHGANRRDALTVTLAAMLVFGVATQWLGVEAVLGAFVAGVVLTRSRYQQAESAHVVEDLTNVIFAPLFFATAGLRLDLRLLSGSALTWAAILVVAALLLKFIGSYLGARVSGMTSQEGLVLGAGLNARGALEIIIATVGLSVGVLNQTSFTMIVMIPLVTSLIASIGVRTFSKDLKGSVAEKERLAREQAMAANLVVRNGRLLLPTRGGPEAAAAARLVDGVWPDELEATVLAMRERDGDRPDLLHMENVLEGRVFDVVDVERSSWAETVVAESRMGYAVAAVGMSHTASQDMLNGSSEHFFTPFVDHLLNEMSVPVVLVKRSISSSVEPFKRALVPVDGSTAARAAQELASSLAANNGVELVFSNVVTRSAASIKPMPRPAARTLVGAGASLSGANGRTSRPLGDAVRHRVKDARQTVFPHDARLAERVLAEAARDATKQRATCRTEVRFASHPAEDVLAHASEESADLIVLGADLRRLDGRPALGRLVEFVLKNASQTVAVVVMPPKAAGGH